MTLNLYKTQCSRIMLKKSMNFIFPVIILALLCLWGNTLGAAASPTNFDGYSRIGSTSDKYGEFRFKLNWKPESGNTLMIADKNKKSQCFIWLSNQVNGVWVQGDKTKTNFDLLVKKINPLPNKPIKNLEYVIKLQKHTWSIYLNNKEIYRFRSPFLANSLWVQNEILGLFKKKLRFQRTAQLYFHDDFLIEENDDNQLDNWEILGGKWHIHSALDAAIEQKTSNRLKKRPLQAQRSANFYSLKGHGENGLIISGYPFHDNYMLEAAIQIKKGECGLAFYVQDEKNFYTFSIYLSDKGNAFALLKKHQPKKEPVIIKAVKLQLLSGQWVMPKIQIFNNRIEAFIDNIKVMEIEEQLPPGGQFGLYVNSENTMIFDDVTAKNLPFIELNSLEDIKFNTLLTYGHVFYQPRFFDWLTGKGKETKLFPGKSKKDRWLVFGHPEDKIASLGASFKLNSKNAKAGLIFGWKNKRNSFYRLLYIQNKFGKKLILERTKGDGAQSKIIKTCVAPKTNYKSIISLKAELAKNGLMLLYCNNQLIMVQKALLAIEGAAGLFASKNSDITVNKLVYNLKPKKIFQDKREKNENFANDPFMRHWASPAGEWIKDSKEDKMWHKSDFFGTFSLVVPIAKNSEVHIGAENNNQKGELILRNKGTYFEILNGEGKSLFKKPTKVLFKKDKNKRPETTYKLKVNESWIWGEFDFKIIFKLKLNKPLKGSRIYIKGFSAAQLGTLRAVRDNVKDFLFAEAPYEWLRNGGTWQVINRFQCDPRWSHMNGQSKNDLASFWSKYQIEGDFCIEMYAGIRHGDWYNRVGDLNLTIMNQKDTPANGYTFICSGWDPDHSQRNSRLFRNGKLLKTSDKYLTPRKRDGNVRKFFNPLINRGRDVHGAWYYIKARRIGNVIEYYFDNEKIFTYEDKNPIKKGGFGIWTFMNSMMVARVKVAAEKIVPKPLSFTKKNVNKIFQNKVKIADKPVLLLNKLPANLMTPAYWKQIDTAGAPKVTFADDKLTVTNILGAGKFAAEANNLIYPDKSISAWTCEIKRTENTKFNFHFELGWQNSQGTYQTLQRYFYQISGTDYSKGLFQLVDTTDEVHPVKIQQLDSNKDWTRVWFPVPNINKHRGSKNLVWKILGFGNFQPSDIVQGLDGNSPGSAYAIRKFVPIFDKVPIVGCKNPDKEKLNFKLILPGMKIENTSLKKFNQALKGLVRPGLISGKLSIPKRTAETDLMWVMPDNESKWFCKWDKEKYNSIIITTDAHYRYLQNNLLKIKINNVERPVEELGVNKFRVSLTEKVDDEFKLLLQDDNLNVEVIKGDKSRKFTLKWKDCLAVAPPILTKLDGITPFFQSFENPEMRKRTNFSSSRMKYKWDNDRKNISLKIANKGKERLNSSFSADLSISKYPIFQFIYKTDPMGQISLKLKDKIYAFLSEPHMDAKKVRFGKELQKDGKWHSWTGLLADAYSKKLFNPSIFKLYNISFGSYGKEDQTGRNSQLFIDDITFGPAIKSPEKLAFTPYYFSRDQEIKVLTAITAGENPYFDLNKKEKKKIAWKKIKNNTKYTPTLNNIKEGVYQLLLKAVDSKGRESKVTSIPFMYDKTPVVANFAFKNTNDPLYNGTLLQLRMKNKGGSPINPKTIKTAFAGKEIKIDKRFTKFDTETDSEIIEINWPYMLRTDIDKMKNLESKKLVVSGLVDGAGNKSKDLHIPIKIDYKKDKQNPSYLKPLLPKSITHRLNLDWHSPKKLPIKMKYVKSKIKKETSGFYTRFSGKNGVANMIFIDKRKKMSKPIYVDSYLAIRLRFPQKIKSSKASLLLHIYFSNKRGIQINLLNGSVKGNSKIKNHLDIKTDKWQNLIIDLKKLYLQRFDRNNRRRENLKDIYIKGLTLKAKHLDPEILFDLNFFTAFAQFKRSDKITLDAYDQSGIKGLEWQLMDADTTKEIAKGKCDGKVFNMDLLPGCKKPHLLKLALSDNAGNKTLPMLFPILIPPPPPPPPSIQHETQHTNETENQPEIPKEIPKKILEKQTEKQLGQKTEKQKEKTKLQHKDKKQ